MLEKVNSHHIISEDNLSKNCPYCGRGVTLRHWRSVFNECNKHYKECTCKCGHKVTVNVPFMGSGDDSWSENLDSRIEDAEDNEKSEEDQESRKE